MGDKQAGKKFRDFAIGFLKIARYDLERAEDAMEDKAYPDVVFRSQQCFEKAIKSALEMKETFMRIHDLSNAFFDKVVKDEEDENWKERFIECLDVMDWFKGEWQHTRYPLMREGKVLLPMEAYDKEKAEDALVKAGFVLETITEFLKERYNIGLENDS